MSLLHTPRSLFASRKANRSRAARRLFGPGGASTPSRQDFRADVVQLEERQLLAHSLFLNGVLIPNPPAPRLASVAFPDLGPGNSNNISCSDLGLTEVTQGVTVTETAQGTFNFTSPVPITVIIAKGGPEANVYTTPPTGATSGTGLTTATNPNNGRLYGLSHVDLCGPVVQQTGNVTVVKSTTGGPFDAGQTFTFTRTGTGASGTVTLAPGGSSTVAVNAGLTAGFTETANPNFSTTFSCTNGVTGTGTVIAPFNVAAGANITCTFVNTRLTGNVTVVKSTTGGPFDAGQTFTFTRTGTGASGTVTLAPGGSSTVAVNAGLTAGFTETANPNFSTTFSCTNGVSGTGTVIAPFNVAAGANITCTFVNTRLTGQIKVIKELRPSNDPGRFNIFADGTVLANAGDASVISPTTFLSGAVVPVGETGGTNPATDLRNYTTTIGCVVENTGAVVVAAGTPLTGDLTRQLNVTVRPGVTIACTLTNTRATGTITVVKSATGGPFDAGQTFTVTVAGQTFNLAPGGSTGPITVPGGTADHADRDSQPQLLDDVLLHQRRHRHRHVDPAVRRGGRPERRLHLHQHPADGADQGHQGAAALERPGPVQHLRRRHGPGQRRRRLGHLADDLPRRPGGAGGRDRRHRTRPPTCATTPRRSAAWSRTPARWSWPPARR